MGGKEEKRVVFQKSIKNRFFPFSKRNLCKIKTQIYFLSRVLMILLRSHPKMYLKNLEDNVKGKKEKKKKKEE